MAVISHHTHSQVSPSLGLEFLHIYDDSGEYPFIILEMGSLQCNLQTSYKGTKTSAIGLIKNNTK